MMPLSVAEASKPLSDETLKSDQAISALIKKAIGEWSGLSEDARKVEILTQNGQVTLRGKVASHMEQKIINEIADIIAQTSNVTDFTRVRISAD